MMIVILTGVASLIIGINIGMLIGQKIYVGPKE